MRPIRSFLFLAFFLFFPIVFLAKADSLYNGQVVEDSQQGLSFFVPRPSTIFRPQLPVLVSLPGNGVKSKDDMKHWKKSANENGFFVLGLDVEYASIKKEEDLRRVQFRVNEALKQVARIYNLRTQKLYLAGSSAGGVTALALSLRYPDDYQAVGVVSGGSMQFNSFYYLMNAQKKQFFIIHGDKDSSIPIDKAYSTQKDLQDCGAVVKFMRVPNGVHTLPSFAYETLVQWFSFQENIFQASQESKGKA